MPVRAYLIEAEEFDGPMNMALDEVLWHEAARGSAFVRLYRWADRPALSLGYFQRSHDVRRDPLLGTLPYVRRLTGGGAIVHDHELTYSLALPSDVAGTTEQLYERFHHAVRDALTEWLGRPLELNRSAADATPPGTELCFHRADRFAVRVGGTKILGSAQRRRAGSVLMHGSLLLERSAAAPDLPGLWDVTPARLPESDVRAMLRRAATAVIPTQPAAAPLPDAILEAARALANAKYRSAAWNDRLL